MRYSVNPSSNQNTLEHKKDNDGNRLQYSYDNNNDYRTWASSDFHFTTNSAKPMRWPRPQSLSNISELWINTIADTTQQEIN